MKVRVTPRVYVSEDFGKKKEDFIEEEEKKLFKCDEIRTRPFGYAENEMDCKSSVYSDISIRTFA